MRDGQTSKGSDGQESQATGLISFHKWLAEFEPGVKAQVKQVSLSHNQAIVRLRSGVPLLSWTDLSLDWPLMQKCFNEVLLAFARHLPGLRVSVEGPCSLVQDIPLLQRVIRACYEGRSLPRVIARGAKGRAQREVLRVAGDIALRPFLTAQQEKLAPLEDQSLWRRGNCWICGGLPDFSFLDREEGARWLICGRCDARWLFLRLECPYCNNQNQDSLSCLLDEEGIYRVNLCDECHSYLKAVDLREKKGEVDMAGQRLETLDLDRQARLAGYNSPGSYVVYRPKTPNNKGGMPCGQCRPRLEYK